MLPDIDNKMIQFLVISKMSEATSILSNLSNQTKLRLKEINKIRKYFNSGIQETRTVE